METLAKSKPFEELCLCAMQPQLAFHVIMMLI